MKVVITANGRDLEATTSLVFGRAPFFLFVDPETLAFEAADNPARDAAGGAGIQAAQFIVKSGAQAVLSGNVGPNAFGVLQAAGIPVYVIGEATVREAVQAFREGCLQMLAEASAQAHAGMRRGGAPRS